MASYSEWLREKGLLTAGIFSGQKSKFGLGDLFFGRGGRGMGRGCSFPTGDAAQTGVPKAQWQHKHKVV